jgi:hypothetical protein
LEGWFHSFKYDVDSSFVNPPFIAAGIPSGKGDFLVPVNMTSAVGICFDNGVPVELFAVAFAFPPEGQAFSGIVSYLIHG